LHRGQLRSYVRSKVIGSLNEDEDDLTDLVLTIDPEHAAWTRGKERGAIGSWTIQIRSMVPARSVQLTAGVGRTAERGGSGDI
jgi:hypothetical protein